MKEDLIKAKNTISKTLNDLQEKYPQKSFDIELNTFEQKNQLDKVISRRIEVQIEAKEVV